MLRKKNAEKFTFFLQTRYNTFMNKGFTKLFWQAVLVGLITGVLVVLFRLGIDKIFHYVMEHFYSFPLIFLLVTTLGGLISGLLVCKLAPETAGSGIPYVKMSLLKSGKLIRIRTIFVKFFAGVIGIGTGLSLGREGPSVQLGAGAGSLVGKLFRLNGNNRDKLIASGAGAAIGATFNAPIAGTLFVLEELIHKFTPAMLFPVLVATVTASTVARHFLGENPAFNISLQSIDTSPSVILGCIILGILCGILGVLFAKLIFISNDLYAKIKIPNYIKPALAGFITGCAGLFVPYILSSGNGAVQMLLAGKFVILAAVLIFLLKFIITPICFGSGAAGGIFLPMLMLGSFLGYISGFVFNTLGFELNLMAAASLGMAGFLSSVARTPITAVVMVFEMTGGYECILPLMLVSAIADLTAEKLNHKPIYAKLVVNQYKNSNVNISDRVLVRDLMTSDVKKFKDDVSIHEILDVMNREKHNAYPVVDKKGRLEGIITKSDIEDVLVDSDMETINAERIIDTNPVMVKPDEDLYTAYYRLHENSTEWAVVVNENKEVLGIITRKDILK